MKIAVWDTYVTREDGKLMHFDILVPEHVTDEHSILGFGTEYLQKKPFSTDELTTKACQFCHIERASEEVIDTIENYGYSIIEMENCD